MPKVQQPVFPDYSVCITDFGAKNDGITLNTEAINNAIKAVNEKGGGKVIIPAGIWLTGPIQLLSNVNLHTKQNALVIFSDDFMLYPIIDTSFEGLNTRRCTSPIWAYEAENIAITGNGVFDGSGDSWRPVKKSKMTENQWKKLLASGGVEEKNVWYPTEGSLKGAKATTEFNTPQGFKSDKEWDEVRPWLRPVLLSFIKCNKVLLEDATFKNSPAWCLHPLMCNDITLDNVKVFNPWYSQNGDALDLESCKNALIVNCLFDAGDDAICIKSGKNEDGRERGIPCENVIVKNNVVLHGHGGFVVGSEMSGGVKNIYVSDCTFMGTDVGLRFKSTRGRGGVVENIFINNIQMIDIPGEALLFDLFYSGKNKTEAMPVTEETPAFRNIQIENVTCKGSGRAMFFNGLPEMPIENIVVKNSIVSEAKSGAVISEAVNVELENVKIIPLDAEKPALQIKKAKNVKVAGQVYENTTSEMQSIDL